MSEVLTPFIHLFSHSTTGVNNVKVYFQGPEPGAEFIADAASMKPLGEGAGDWKTQANARIDSLRKHNVHIK